MKKGFSLVEIMLVLAALGGVALLVTKLGKNTMEIQTGSFVLNDYNDLVRDAHFLLADPKSCKVSLAGITFPMSGTTVTVENVEIWKSDSKGINRIKKVISQNEKFKKLTIESVSLSIDATFGKVSSAKEIHSTTGTLKIKPILHKNKMVLEEIEHNLNLNVNVDTINKKVMIVNCGDPVRDEKSFGRVWCGLIVNPCGTETLEVVGVGHYKNGLFTGIFQPKNIIDYKLCTSARNHPATFSNCE